MIYDTLNPEAWPLGARLIVLAVLILLAVAAISAVLAAGAWLGAALGLLVGRSGRPADAMPRLPREVVLGVVAGWTAGWLLVVMSQVIRPLQGLSVEAVALLAAFGVAFALGIRRTRLRGPNQPGQVSGAVEAAAP